MDKTVLSYIIGIAMIAAAIYILFLLIKLKNKLIHLLFYRPTKQQRYRRTFALGFNAPGYMKAYIACKHLDKKRDKDRIDALQKRIDDKLFCIFPDRAISIVSYDSLNNYEAEK